MSLHLFNEQLLREELHMHQTGQVIVTHPGMLKDCLTRLGFHLLLDKGEKSPELLRYQVHPRLPVFRHIGCMHRYLTAPESRRRCEVAIIPNPDPALQGEPAVLFRYFSAFGNFACIHGLRHQNCISVAACDDEESGLKAENILHANIIHGLSRGPGNIVFRGTPVYDNREIGWQDILNKVSQFIHPIVRSSNGALPLSPEYYPLIFRLASPDWMKQIH